MPTIESTCSRAYGFTIELVAFVGWAISHAFSSYQKAPACTTWVEQLLSTTGEVFAAEPSPNSPATMTCGALAVDSVRKPLICPHKHDVV